MKKIGFVAEVLLLFLAGCSQMRSLDVQETTTQVTPTQTRSSSFTVIPMSTVHPENAKETPVMNQVPIPTPLDPSLEKIVVQVKNDLAQRLVIDPEQIELVEAASVTWPDGSIGCPQPDMAYTQVQVDGLLIRLRTKDRTYEYHSGGTRAPFLCE